MSETATPTPQLADADLEGYAELRDVLAQAWTLGRDHRFMGEPKEVLDRLIAEVPDHFAVLAEAEFKALSKEGPSDFELYLLSRIGDIPVFAGAAKRDGGLRVMESVRCLRDQIRTKKFLRGVADAVVAHDDGRAVIRVCDAGCGAVPVQAIYAALVSPRAQCTCIEINEYSAHVARSVVASFELQDRITIVQDDATKFTGGGQFDILVSETMHAALTAEPVVQIMSHLQSFVARGGVMLPDAITVRAAVMRVEEYDRPRGFVRLYGDAQYYVEPEWQTIVMYHPGDTLEMIESTMPLPDAAGDYIALINSEVDIGNEHLAPYESLITTPQVLREYDLNLKIFRVPAGAPPARVRLRYRPGDLLEDVESQME